MAYITCNHKKSNPKINVLVCEKCSHMKNCADYSRYIQPSLFSDFKVTTKQRNKETQNGIR